MVDFDDHEMRPGTAIWIRPGQVQRWDLHDDFHADVAVFRSSSIPDLPLFDRFLGSTVTAHMGDDMDRLHQQMEWMANDLASNADKEIAAAVVAVILRLFARHAWGNQAGHETPGQQLGAAFVESIEANISERSVSWHAQQIGASTRSVARATAETFGQRPKDVIDARVILEAQRRLAWSEEDIATIARELRFSEASNFTKFFRTRTGVSPSTFRTEATAIRA
jgi:AraC-like DNA-binding protein